jgi:hypothetical protein
MAMDDSSFLTVRLNPAGDEATAAGPGQQTLALEVVDGPYQSVSLVFGDAGHAGTGGPDRHYAPVFASADAWQPQAGMLLFFARAIVRAEIDHDGFNRWYNTRHLPDVSGAGLRGARRYRRIDEGHHEYLAIYQHSSPEVFASEELIRVRGFGPFESDIVVFERLETRVTSVTDGPQ